MYLDPAKLKFIGFGRGQAFYNYFTPNYSFQIRNIRFLDALPPRIVFVPAAPLSRLTEIARTSKKLNVLLLGDSITDFAGASNYAAYSGNQLKKKWGIEVNVVNAGIAGHSARSGHIVLPRALRSMPNPDMVCIFYGANDCKSCVPATGYDADAFGAHLEALIDKVRYATEGKADIVLLSGVSRVAGGNKVSNGVVEQIAKIVPEVCKKKQATFCDSLSSFLPLPAGEKRRYYRDTIHLTAQGHLFLGNLLYEILDAHLQKARL